MQGRQIRDQFIKFFEQRDHRRVASSSIVPENDPTLLFTNAGMNQFKDYFTGKATPQFRRAVTAQKCVRAGGKHNDLENVGFTARHHTFFEMLGNFSFGDYFKEEAISMAWTLLTEVLGFPKERLFVTVHHSDEEAALLWEKKVGVAKERIFYRGDKDNFWEMGEIGPCGPCSEIFYDHGEAYRDPKAIITESILDDDQRYVEIWNLVFMQFERFQEGGKIVQAKLPKPSVDTGAGLERLAAALQKVYNNFETDLFSGIVAEIEAISKKSRQDKLLVASMRVVADHVRAATMMISDGVIPSNEGRGYVLRRIIRRAVRHLDYLSIKEPTLHRLVDSVFATLGSAYPENLKNKSLAQKYLQNEEEHFRETLSSGLALLAKEIEQMKRQNEKKLSGLVGFKLYDTHGFPLDLTEMILREQGLLVDHQGFDQEMEKQRARSRSQGDFAVKEDQLKKFYALFEKWGAINFKGYESQELGAKLLEKIDLGGGQLGLVFDQTPFYAESGGQVADQGTISLNGQVVAEVLDTQKPVDQFWVHRVKKRAEELEVGKSYQLGVDRRRRELTAYNHTATHLLQAALVAELGDHVKQAGSYVGPDRLRFDFTHPEALSPDQLERIEEWVQNHIRQGLAVESQVMTKAEAIAKGATALFGEKYGSQVRVIEVGEVSRELCGGTHASNTRAIGHFLILSESSLAAGVRRIDAVTGPRAWDLIRERLKVLAQLESTLGVRTVDLTARLTSLLESQKEREREIRELKEKIQSLNSTQLFSSVESLANVPFLNAVVAAGSDLRKIGDLFVDKFAKGIVVLFGPQGDDRFGVLVKRAKNNNILDCARLLSEVLKPLGGKGGGKEDMAQGSISSKDQPLAETQLREKILRQLSPR